MLKVHSGHRYRPHRTVCLRLNTQVREKRDASVHSPFSNHTTENKLTLPVYHSAQHIVLKGHTNILLSDKDARNTNKNVLYGQLFVRSPLPSASTLRLPSFLPSASTFHLPPPACRQPPAACRQLPPMRPCYMPPHRSAQAPPSEPRRTFPPGRDRLPFPAATDKKMRPEGRIRKFSNICQTDIYKFN